MIYRNKVTGEEREFVPGIRFHSNWVPVIRRKTEHGTITLSEVNPEEIYTNKSKKAAETRAKNKAQGKKSTKKEASK